LNKYFEELKFTKKMKSFQITIKDIAKRLGISPSTVSRALKGHPDISEKTRNAVEQLAKELKYKPNAIALSLRQNKSNVIGIIIPQIVHHFFSSIISGVEDYASNEGYNTIICQSNELEIREKKNIQTLISTRVEGILISRTKETKDISHFKNVIESNIPIVFFDRICPEIITDSVIIDDFGAAYNATELLIKTGCAKLSHFMGNENIQISTNRKAGFEKAINHYGLNLYPEFLVKADSFDEGYEQMEKLILKNQLPDGIFAVNDMTAFGILSSLKKHKIKVPEQISVIGFSNEIISQFSDPPLTTIEQHGYEMGFKAAELLINRIKSEKENDFITEIIPANLIIRDSTKKK
jgi:LacI family transcriptional regulator